LENNALVDQLFKLKTQGLKTNDENNPFAANKGSLFTDTLTEQDQMVDLLKRNHDAMMHKYETYR
jgi:hypothetical protein